MPASIFTDRVSRAFEFAEGDTGARTPGAIDKAALSVPLVDRGRLPSPPTPNQLQPGGVTLVQTGIGGAAQRPGQAQGVNTLINNWWNLSPAALIQDIQPKQSNATAHGYYFLQSRSLWDLMDEMVGKSIPIKGAFRQCFSIIQTFPENFSVIDDDDQEATKWRDVAQKALTEIDGPFDWTALKRDLTIMPRQHGFSFVQIFWEPRKVTWRDGGKKTVTGTFLCPTAYQHCHPGLFVFDSMATGYYAPQILKGQAQDPDPLPQGRFALAIAPSQYANPYGESDLFDMRYAFAILHAAQKFWVRYCDKFGDPMTIVKYETAPAGMNAQMDSVERAWRKAEAIATMQNVQEAVGVALPAGMEVEFIQRATKGGSPHEGLVQHYERQLIGYIQGSTLATGESSSGSGSRAASQIHEITMREYQKPSADGCAKSITRDVLNTFLLLNAGPDMIGRVVYGIDTKDAADLDAIGKRVDIAKVFALPVSQKQLRAETGWTAPDPDDPEDSMVAVQSSGPGVPTDPSSVGSEPPAGGFSEFGDKASAEVSAAYKAYRAAVNMSAAKLENLKIGRGKTALSPTPIHRNVHLLVTPKSLWGPKEIAWANRTVAAIARLKAKGAKRETLMNYGHDPAIAAVLEASDDDWERDVERFAADGTNDAPDLPEIPPDPSIANRAFEISMAEWLETVAAELGPDAEKAARAWVEETVRRMEAVYAPDALITDTNMALPEFELPANLVNALAASQTAAGTSTFRAAANEIPAIVDTPRPATLTAALDGVDPAYRSAFDWLKGRKLATTDSIKDAAQAQSAFTGKTAVEVEAELRGKIQAIKAAVDERLQALFQDRLAEAVGKGTITARDFIKEFTPELEALEYVPPMGIKPYLEMVFRTEMSNAYNAQRLEYEADPAVADFIWGHEYFNPHDARSRESHADINGLIVKKGSAADEAMPPGPPWAFSCRCASALLVNANPAKNQFTESPDALERVKAIETFDSGKKE